ncbi:run domain Beclin-1-interacting and cysteine-rich domain-containing protein isoform X1 [Rhagoletis pomonella]|uniref:run domain Beclin-1-interacting and cysteine-rich domain-containing protein isoform X1 n=1 Tax=Rhagoletis pomonella TaxID=28610 RepID=UPI0017816395|nr:run domain Beclin-1-interacting and cysteine-rich domain-containing protein isoform X1 [Rhagoletis pomonella]
MSDFDEVGANAESDLPVLLANLKKACGLWFHNAVSEKLAGEKTNSSYDNITTTTVEILRHGLRLTPEDAVMPKNFSPADLPREKDSLYKLDGLKKLMDDFEWVCRSAQIRDSLPTDFSELSALSNKRHQQDSLFTVQDYKWFFDSWVRRNLKANCLSVCLQLLVAENELLNAYYKENAFLRNEVYSTALIICLSAVELNQYSLLSQIETQLYSVTSSIAAVSALPDLKHRRTTSPSVFSISPPKHTKVCETDVMNEPQFNIENKDDITTTQKTDTPNSSSQLIVPALSTFRKTKSLPALQHKPCVFFDSFNDEKPRPRCKTMVSTHLKTSSPQDILSPIKAISTTSVSENASNIANDEYFSNSNTTTNTTTTTGSSYCGSDLADMALPSTSLQSQQKYFLLTPSSTHTQPTASSYASSDCRIELINCDDIKIWTDQAYDETQNQQTGQQEEAPTTEPCTIPQRLEPLKQKAKSASPIGSFLCNLFSTPPTYTHWSILNQTGSSCGLNSDDTEGNAVAAVFPCTLVQPADISSSSTGGMFDAFMPVCGKKLRSRNSQSLFEDSISTLDYKSPTNESSNTTSLENAAKPTKVPKKLSKCQQSLTDFLQTSQMSRNNTDLEKENAHFRVSEAIISAIEHIKWDNSKDPEKKWRRRRDVVRSAAAASATDCLAPDGKEKNGYRRNFETESSYDESSEHIPYAELGESCLDLLSAEVIGLSIISKFSDKHLPKVSELKWLVSEEDTPQQLLPMPDDSPTANPDENVIRPITRGTRYWAPPRQQIIFTDHPSASRKELILKQNSRCAGCGMRVSRQYINSFRYCTYLGKYHCTGCHRNQISPIPAKILRSWDFKCYPVSVFSYRLLEQMYTYPLFYVPDLNPVLYVDNKALLSARRKRIHLQFVKDFIKTCRFAVRDHVYFESIPEHITNDPDIWSLSDFIDVHNKSMQRSIDQLIEKCEHHIFNCVLCTARGFHCEYCQKDQVIYPWQPKVFRCDCCGSCFHLNCWKLMSNTCCRCQRINKRQEIAVI